MIRPKNSCIKFEVEVEVEANVFARPKNCCIKVEFEVEVEAEVFVRI